MLAHCATILVATFVGAPTAQAVEPVVADKSDVISEHVARGGATDVPGAGCRPVCQELWGDEYSPVHVEPRLNSKLTREFFNLRSKAGVLPYLRAINTIGLAGHSFKLGWKIGTGVRARWVELTVPKTETWNPEWRQELRFIAKDSSIYYGLSMPYDGWLWHWWDPDFWRMRNFWVTAVEHGDPILGCPQHRNPTSVPLGLEELIGPPHPDCGSYASSGSTEANGGVAHAGVVREDALVASPSADYTNQPYEHDTPYWGAPSSKDRLEDAVRENLLSGRFPTLDAWYAFRLDSQDYEDPADSPELDECRPPGAQPDNRDPTEGRTYPHHGIDPDAWRERYKVVPAAAFPPPNPPGSADSVVPADGLPTTGGGRAYMRWGWTIESDNGIQVWRGWGYAKIKAKHGWSAEALQRTKEALGTQPSRESFDDEYRDALYPGRTGKPCRWVVVVQREPREEPPENPERTQDAPMGGIITAHGARVAAR